MIDRLRILTISNESFLDSLCNMLYLIYFILLLSLFNYYCSVLSRFPSSLPVMYRFKHKAFYQKHTPSSFYPPFLSLWCFIFKSSLFLLFFLSSSKKLFIPPHYHHLPFLPFLLLPFISTAHLGSYCGGEN